MKRSAKPLFPQMNLPLGNVSATNNLDDQNLLVALTELLVGAAEEEEEEESEQPRNGGEDESEAHA
jgi:hypothetical protein